MSNFKSKSHSQVIDTIQNIRLQNQSSQEKLTPKNRPGAFQPQVKNKKSQAMNTRQDHFHAQLYLERLSRDLSGFNKNQNKEWTQSKSLEKAFLENHPDFKESYHSFMATQKKKWGELFVESFQKLAIASFVKSNLKPKDYRQ